MNVRKIAKLWREIIKEIGDNPEREGLKETPMRIARMYQEIFKGYRMMEKSLIKTFGNDSDGVLYNGMICDTGCFYSYCEHHSIPFFGEYYFSYIPNKRVIGLSKVARVIDFYCARLQVQERLTKQIVDEIEKVLSPKGIILVLKGRHLCKEMRGVKKVNGFMITAEARGCFRENTKNEKVDFMRLVGFNTNNLL